ncbi:poly-beta-hydroxybutyrate-responsive repressor [Ureibacillus thermophilus]|uniref:Poly-beta-hydroxybutyrate-responsive repressor n=1 Tax=Ureibacillus thermophilus TaxID=367743 RepID=A0A4P6URV9_9BACL|nr:poly-beta-hydroxybutyrate-responsive repressor [Ureibacillus thermophilus]
MVSKEEKKKPTSPSIGAPKNFLIPLMLLHLREFHTHGYELMEKLTKFGIESLDHGNFYRLLRQLEKENLVTSVWDTSSGGPAKRIYSITEAGEKYLDMWAHSLSEYQKLLNQFFNLYNPFFSANTTNSKQKDEAAPKSASTRTNSASSKAKSQAATSKSKSTRKTKQSKSKE